MAGRDICRNICISTGMSQKMTLKNRAVMVTGSTSGIGLGLARGFARAGANVVRNGFGDPVEIKAIQAELEKSGATVIYDGADMTKPDDIARMVVDAERRFGVVDIPVHNTRSYWSTCALPSG